jgi:alpha-L-rhamnosidase
LTDPIGIDELMPRFFWWVEDSRPAARQSAYRIRVAASLDLLLGDRPDLWDSGRVEGDQQTHVVYDGIPLTSRRRCYWDVALWDSDGVEGPASPPAVFEMGLLDRADWSASWVSTLIEEGGLTLPPAPLLRKSFHVTKPILQARLYVSALGLYEAHLNGRRIGDDYFRPGWTDYRRRVQYQTYDVTQYLHRGENALAAMLGDGWYSGRIAGLDRGMQYGTKPALLAQLEIVHQDGTTMRVVSDGSWLWREGPIRRQDMLEGEEFDARCEIERWDEAGCDEGPFSKVVPIDWPDAKLVASPAQPVRVRAELRPIAPPVVAPGGWGRSTYIFDLGQNFAGIARLAVKGPRGLTMRLRYGEMLASDGSLYTANLRSACAIDLYTLKGDADGETWTPRFTCHGFRYVELSYQSRLGGTLAPITEGAITGLVLMSDTPEAGEFSCSDPLVDQLQSNIQWGQRSNFLEAPTDCPQRDERLGWTGDAQVFAPTAAFNMDVAAFFTKWSRDCDDAQKPCGGLPSVAPNVLDDEDGGPGWSDARVLCPWAMYNAYGDIRLLKHHYEAMKRWLEWQAGTMKDGLRCYDGCGYFQGYSDWLALDSTWQSVWSATPRDFIGTAYFAHSAGTMREIAGLLGRQEDAARFARLREEAVDGFNRHFVTPAGRLAVQTQTAHLMALAWDLLPAQFRAAAFARLLALLEERKWHLSTGFLGTPLVCPVLTRFGRTDLAYRVFLQQDYPGWLFPVRNGATTMWERWNSWTPEQGFGDVGMNSFNHYAYGAIGRWMVDTIAGLAIDPDCPAYKHVLVAPQPGGGLTHARAALNSIHGRIETAWRIEGDRFHLEVLLPANVTAEAALPDGTKRALAAGRHELECTMP